MASLSSVYLLFLYVGTCIYGQNFFPETCVAANESSVGIHLNQCNMDSMIHVKEEMFGKADEFCIRDNTCLTGRSDTDTGLTVNCNGLHTCTEIVSYPNDRCDSSNISVRVWYECINGSSDLCSQFDDEKDGSVYLHSPGFPNSVGVPAMCSCNITGSEMRVELLELYSRHVLNISADGVQVWPAQGKLPTQYNAPVINNSAKSLILVYAGVSEHVKQNAWVKVTGSLVRVTCSGNSTEIPSHVSTTSTNTPTKSPTSSTSPTQTSTSSVLSTGSTDTSTIHNDNTMTPTSYVSSTESTGASSVDNTNPGSTLAISAVSEAGNSLPIEMIAGIAGGGGLLLIFSVVVSIVACRLKRKREGDKSVSNLERQEDYSTVDGDPVGNCNPYVDTPTTDRHSAFRSYRFQNQSGDGSGKNVANANHDNNNHDVYSKIIHPKLRNSAPTNDFESEQTYNHIPSRKDMDKSSQNTGQSLDVDDYDDTYNTNIQTELKDRKEHIKDSEQTYDHIPSSTPVGVSKDITNDTSSDTYYNISGPTSGSGDNSEQTYDHLVSSGVNNKSSQKTPPNPSTTEVSADVSLMYTTVVRPSGNTKNQNDRQHKHSPESIQMDVFKSENKLAVEEADIYYQPPVPDKLFSEDDEDGDENEDEDEVAVENDEDDEDEREKEEGDSENEGSAHSVASNYSSFNNKVPPVKEKPVMEDNDLYHSYKPSVPRKPDNTCSSKGKTQSVGRSTEDTESDANGRPEMVDNDLYHSYKK